MDNHRTADGGFVVQRVWSNRAAAGGHDPCVPSRPSQPYLALVPRTSTVRLANEGESATILLDARADRPTPRWNVSAFDLTGYQEHASYVDASVDRVTAQDGDTVELTVTLRRAHDGGQIVLGAVSTLGVIAHMWPIAVVTH
jgi:hypothetical protein